MLKLRMLGDPILKTPARIVPPGEDLALVIQNLRFGLKIWNGLGVSAQQVGSTHRVCVMVLSGTVHVCINLEILQRSKAMQKSIDEGCLSVRSEKGEVFRRDMERHQWVVIRYEDEHRVPQTRELTGLNAIVAQHESDHLDGKCIADGMSREDRKESYRDQRRRKVR